MWNRAQGSCSHDNLQKLEIGEFSWQRDGDDYQTCHHAAAIASIEASNL
jgi:hypothetical protein